MPTLHRFGRAPIAGVLLWLLAGAGCANATSVRVELALEGPPAIAEWFPRLVLVVEVKQEISGNVELGLAE
jgi:hypothetical protein